MSRRPRRSHASRAKAATKAVRFIADYDHVEIETTKVYRAGTVLIDLPEAHRRAALASGKAVLDGE